MANDPTNDGEFKHRPRKRFGQNFLHDTNVIERVVESINPSENDHIIEIGPGQGALTKYLLPACKKLEVIELDRDLASFLANGLQKEKHFEIHQLDVLKFDFNSLGAEEKSLRIVGNLPYNISTPVMFYLLKYHHLIKDMTFMLQLEVVNRLAAEAGNKNYGRLGLMVQYHCQVDHLFNVPSTAFTPQPKVSSAIVRLTPHQTLPTPAKDIDLLKVVIRTAFNQRRKTLKNSLKTLVSEDVLNTLPLDTSLRPENMSLQDYVLISDAISAMTEND
jgi:16S rRNA (adenine1518-N6/adenine1519-N6)-dimethyltransferase